MAEQIRDGTGTGNLVKIDSDNNMRVKSETTSAATSASFSGDSYNLNTGTITLTSANKSALMYLKNNEDDDLVIEAIIEILGNTTGGLSTENHTMDIIRNPTEGTIISSPTNVSHNQNRNFGSSKTLTVDAFKGAEGDTFTNGTIALSDIFNNEGLKFITTASIILPKGSSLGVDITPKTSNTKMEIQIAISAYLKPVGEL